MTLVSLITFVALGHMSSTMATFPRESPVLFVRSERPVISEWRHVRHDIVFADMCIQFVNKQDIKNKQHRWKLSSWCHIKYMKQVMEPLFKVATDLSGRRHERGLFAGIAIVTSILALGKTVTTVYSNSERLDQMTASINKMRELMRNSMAHVTTLDLAMAERDKLILEHQQFLNDFPELSSMVADVSSRIEVEGSYVKKIVRGIKRRRIDPAFFDLFETKLEPEAILDNVRLLSIWINVREGYLQVNYQVAMSNPRLSWNEADAFTLYANQTRNGTVEQCVYDYHGPSFVLVSPSCAFAVAATEQQIQATAYGFRANQTCHIASDQEQDGYWTPSRCGPPSQPVIQVKYTSGDSYIYCPTWTIELTNFSMPCPDYVFRLPSSTRFRLGQMEHTGDRTVLLKKVSLVDFITVLHHLYPRSNDPLPTFLHNPNVLAADIQKDMDALDNMPFLSGAAWNVWAIAPWSMLGVIALVYLYKGISVIRRWMPQKRGVHSQSHTRRSAIEMAALPSRRQRRTKVSRNAVASDTEEADL